MSNIEPVGEISNYISSISKSVSGREEPQFLVFLFEDIEPRVLRHISKIPGMVAGAAIGGGVGEALFGGALLSEEDYKYSGTLKVLIAEQDQISIGTFNKVPFASEKGEIGVNHLYLVKERCHDDTFVKELFVLPSPDVTLLGDGNAVQIKGRLELFLPKAELFVDGEIYATSELGTIGSIIKGATGTLAEQPVFLERLQSGELDPIRLLSENQLLTQTQVLAALGDQKYFDELVDFWESYSTRDELIDQARSLTTAIRQSIRKAMRLRSEGLLRLKAWKVLWIVLGVGWVVASLFAFVTSAHLRVPDISEFLLSFGIILVSVIGTKYCSSFIEKKLWFTEAAKRLSDTPPN